MRLGGGSRNLLGFVAIAVAAFVVTLYLVPASTGSQTNPGARAHDGADVAGVPESLPEDIRSPLPNEGPATESPPPGSASRLPGMRGYVLPLAELRGVSSTSTPGTRLEIWVTWRRDVGGGSQVQRVVTEAVLGRVIEPTVPEGPETVEIFIPVNEFPDFLAAHEFGSLNAAIVP